MNEVKVLLLEYEKAEEPGSVLRKTLVSAGLAFQIESGSLKPLAQDSVTSLVSTVSPQMIILVGSGLEAFHQMVSFFPFVKERFWDVPIMAVIEAGDSEDILKLLHTGVDDFVTLPLDPAEVLLRVRRLLEKNVAGDSVSE